MKKAILMIIDGLGDLPTPKTPLQAAKTPNFDKLAKNGIIGLMTPLKRYLVPGSDTSHLQILGYDPAVFYNGRGPLEALGLGIKLEDGDVAFRANFATLKNNEITDRRAGRVDTQTASALSKYLSFTIDGVQAIFMSSVEHRGVLVLRGHGLNSEVSDTDPHALGQINECHQLVDLSDAKRTADIVNKFTQLAIGRLSDVPENKGRKLPANCILLRGAGVYKQVPSFYERFGLNAVCIAGGALYRGVATYLGMDVILVPGATGDKNTDLNAKADSAVRALQNYDLVFMHIKGCDNAGHDGDFNGKKKMIERIDSIMPKLEKTGACIIVTADHSTPVSRKGHSGHEVPILVYGGERVDKVKKFDEISCMDGGLGHIRGKDVVNLILNITERAEKFGS
ncbi:2,3-bisphosphoglycerate-independent phosphoglycerate mutase [Candidatus Micrarchaeota archaeon]|nr:2,3-bisphosphoglycerate-independent phosphoglycerate mutase [Candidatus Micrarchaeota archaeon]MBU1165380.1 2,3-bisphosphoglycerate-independent phosphoglycerate mutase [Candidatus Micrarchaeota archaeon]MBU1886221.1 2,3-bisphosphoglycerate-independent phosphoglycerate mutase [Candidatus Micrarchaeota archaeon]